VTLPASFWQNEREQLASIMVPKLQAMAAVGIAAAEKKLAALNIFVDNAKAHEQAALWARLHTDELLNQLEVTTQGSVGRVLENYIATPGQTIGDLKQSLMPLLDNNAVRADRIAVTETTRAFSRGNGILYELADIPKMAYEPPAHTNCRCDSRVVRIKDKWLVVWLSLRDELTCIRPIETPWGVVAGCRALHNVIISEGEWLGRKYTDV
jgi:hypothetical protein